MNRSFCGRPQCLAELLEDDLDADAHELRDLRVSGFGAFIVAFLRVDVGLTDLDEVTDDLRDLLAVAQRALETRPALAQSAHEARAPRRKRVNALRQSSVVTWQQWHERHLGSGQRRPACGLELNAELPKLRVRGPRRAELGSVTPEPSGDRLGAADAQRAAQAAMELCRADRGAGVFERPREHWKPFVAQSDCNAITARDVIDPCTLAVLYCSAMATAQPNERFDLELKRLEKRLDDLVSTCKQLKEENSSLKGRQDSLIAERATLLQKNEQVRGRVEAMITRLKSMEQAS